MEHLLVLLVMFIQGLALLLHVTYFQHICTVFTISFSLLFRAQNSLCMCRSSGAISSLFLLVILHGCRASIASAPTLATLGTSSDTTRSSRVDDLAQQLGNWWILAFSGSLTNGTEERKHGPIGAS